jgi:hypothetical protein
MAVHEHEKRPDIGPRFTESDPLCLQWIGEQGGAQFGQVQKILARLSPNPEKLAVPGVLSVQRTRKKIAKWKQEGLIESRTFLANERGWLWLTKPGQVFSGLGDLRYYEPKLESLRHHYWVNQARLYIEQQRPGDTWKSERLIRYEQPALLAGKKTPHIPDALLIKADGDAIAIEVELSSKKRARVQAILRELSTSYYRTWYFVAQPAWAVVEAALAQLSERQRNSIQMLSVEEKLK